MSKNDQASRGLWLTVILLGSLFAATIAGMVFRAVGAGLPATLGAGGATFAGAVTLGLSVRNFMSG